MKEMDQQGEQLPPEAHNFSLKDIFGKFRVFKPLSPKDQAMRRKILITAGLGIAGGILAACSPEQRAEINTPSDENFLRKTYEEAFSHGNNANPLEFELDFPGGSKRYVHFKSASAAELADAFGIGADKWLKVKGLSMEKLPAREQPVFISRQDEATTTGGSVLVVESNHSWIRFYTSPRDATVFVQYEANKAGYNAGDLIKRMNQENWMASGMLSVLVQEQLVGVAQASGQ